MRLISTRSIPDAKLQEAEKEIERRCGRKAEISVASVASQSELAQLMQKLALPPPSPPKPVAETLPEMQQELITRITPVLNSVWPPEAPVQGFDVALSASGIALNVRYESTQTLGKIPLDMITRDLQEKLGVANLSLTAKRVAVPRRVSRNANRIQ